MKKALKVLSTVMAAGMLAACGSTAASSTATSATSTAESTAASSDEAVTLRLGHTQPTDHQVNITAERFAELVNEYSGGSVTVEVYPNSTFGSASEMNAAVQSGDLDLYVNASAQFASQYEPMTVVDAWYIHCKVKIFVFHASAVKLIMTGRKKKPYIMRPWQTTLTRNRIASTPTFSITWQSKYLI